MKNDSWQDENWNLNLQRVLCLIFWIEEVQNLTGFLALPKKQHSDLGKGKDSGGDTMRPTRTGVLCLGSMDFQSQA